MVKKIVLLLSALVVLPTFALAEEAPLPFSMPIPEGWRTETIPFPLDFAPDLPYSGLEELRFAPGMFKEGEDDFWSYAFIWWIKPDELTNVESFSAHLETYFRGLAKAVAASNEFSVGDATFSASLKAGANNTFVGLAETLDAFVTRGQIKLNVRGKVMQCPQQNHAVVFFALSPQDAEHAVWSQLDSIRDGFRCDASEES